MDILDLLDLTRTIRLPIERIFRDRSNPFDIYNDKDFRYRYRLTRQSVLLLTDMLEQVNGT